MIYHNKLNQLLIANQKRYLQRQASVGPGGKICPVCQGENKECRYFQPLADTGSQSDFSIENSQQWEDGQDQRALRLAAVKEKLLGNILTVSDYDDQYTLDLGKNLIVAKRYLDLDQPLKEMPLVKEIVNWLIPDGLGKRPLPRVPFFSLVLQAEEIPLQNLDEASRQLINTTIREKMVQENIHSSWEWLPVLLRGKEISHLPEGKKYFNAVELLDKETFCRCLELVYQHFSSVEDEFLARMNPTNINQCRYPCEDYHQSRAKIKKTLKQAQAAILAKLNTIKEGQVDE
jgi:hypothetical protein